MSIYSQRSMFCVMHCPVSNLPPGVPVHVLSRELVHYL